MKKEVMFLIDDLEGMQRLLIRLDSDDPPTLIREDLGGPPTIFAMVESPQPSFYPSLSFRLLFLTSCPYPLYCLPL